MERRHALRDVLSGLIFVAFGLAFGIAAAGYGIGTALRMGPGYFPLVLAGVLCAFGVAILVKGLITAEADGPIGPVPWRGMALLFSAILFFGATVRGLGLAPTLFLTVFLAALADRGNTLVSAALLAVALTLFCSLIFISGLGVALPLLGPWWPV